MAASGEGRRRGGALRGTGAVLAGLIVIVVLSTVTDAVLHATGVFPPVGQPMSDALFLLALAYRVVYSVAGFWLTARLAPERPMRHVMILAVVGLVVSIAGAAATWGRGPAFGPAWYPLTLIATVLPCAWIGGKLGERRTPAI